MKLTMSYTLWGLLLLSFLPNYDYGTTLCKRWNQSLTGNKLWVCIWEQELSNFGFAKNILCELGSIGFNRHLHSRYWYYY